MTRLVLFLLAQCAVFAHGAKDVESKTARDNAGWQESFDLSEKKSGKYNIFVRATDMGGNQALEGPFNLYVDPESDKPVCSITNPRADMRVMENLNIVGTCVDDDAVQYVMLVLDGDEANPVRAEGTEFWSYYLDTHDLPEGPHTIQVTGYDIKGVAGNPVSVQWQLDRRTPATEVTNHSMGVLVSGAVKFSGTVTDGNGIKALAYSVDNGETFLDLKLSAPDKKTPGLRNFTFSLDTTAFEDGPNVLWFRADDAAGSTGVYSFLYFIDNTKPDVKIVTPEEKEVRYGKVAVAGYAKDAVGITKLTWQFGQETGEFELVPGNPYWGAVFDTAGAKDSARKFTVTATDIAGNVVAVSRTIPLDQELDRPLVQIAEPSPENPAGDDGEIFVRGVAADPDGIQSVRYSLDGGEFTELATEGAFCGVLAHGGDLSAGSHKVTVIAVDRNGVQSRPVTAEFSALGKRPVFDGGKIVASGGGKKGRGKAAQNAPAGEKIVAPDGGESLNGRAVHPEAGDSIQVAAYSALGLERMSWEILQGGDTVLSGGEEISGAASGSVTVPVTPDFPRGVVRLVVRATDTAGRESDYKAFLYVTNPAALKSDDPQIVFSDSTVGADGVIVYDREFPASGYFIGGNAVKAELVPRTPFAEVRLKGNSVTLVPTDEEGESEPVVVRVTTDQGLTYESRRLVFRNSARGAESIRAHFVTVGGELYVSGIPVIVPYGGAADSTLTAYIECDTPPSSVTYELSGDDVPGGSRTQTGTLKPVSIGSTKWSADIPLADLPARLTTVKLSVKAGSASKEITGTISVMRPPHDGGLTDDSLAVYAGEDSGAEYDENSRSYIVPAGSSFSYYANVPAPVSAEVAGGAGFSLAVKDRLVVLTAVEGGVFPSVKVRVTDGNGVSYDAPPVSLTVAAAPEIHFTSPEPHGWVKNQAAISGTVTDATGVKAAEYSVDGGGTWKALSLSVTGKGGIGATFSGTAELSALPDGLVGIDVRVTDGAGKVTVARTAVCKDTQPPAVTVVLPADEDIVNGENMIAFAVEDAGRIDKMTYVQPPSARVAERRTDFPADKFTMTHVGTVFMPIDETMAFEFTDAAGNTAVVESWQFMIDNESDLPRAEIHLPTDNEVITEDFTVSGVVYDDDGASTIWYKIDGGEYRQLPEPGTSFYIDVPFSSMTDNEHTVFVYAVDVNGVQGPVAERKFRISTEEPKCAVESPSIDATVKEIITVKGVASDKNGIDRVLVSLDNGNSYNDAVGQEDWTYTFDTRAVPNGTQVMFIKIFDKYGIQGLYSSIVTIDNKAPEMMLDLPSDYSITKGPLFFSGHAFDDVNIAELFVTIRSLENKSVPKRLQRVDFDMGLIIAQTVDISELENGFYNVELTALDNAGNATHISRNIQLDKTKPLAVANLLYPLNGEHKQGVFNIYGEVTADKPVESIALYVDDKYMSDTELTKSGYFRFNLTPEILTDGVHQYYVDVRVEGGSVIRSRVQTVDYTSVGPWITIDNFTYGDFAVNRPYIQGNSGYSLSDDELLISKTKDATKEQKQAIADKQVAKVELSFDNGRSFTQISKNEKWMYRIENMDMPEGFHFLLLRATMRNGETAIVRTIVQIDNTAPTIRLISPEPGGRYNEELLFSGLSGDDVELKDVELTLRKGDKASYEVPGFIQGLYLDWHFWGATLFDIGIGLTFFDDNVKLQFQWGQFTQAQRDAFSKTNMRYGGDNVMGIKILANVGFLPFSYFLGHDWEWLSASFAVGANFTRFNESASGEAQILSALLAQIEFPRVNFPQMKMFSTYSLYGEFQLWFIPTDVEGTSSQKIDKLIPQFSGGIRVNVF